MTKLKDKIKETIKQAKAHIKPDGKLEYALPGHKAEKISWLKRTLDGKNEDKISATEKKMLKEYLDDFKDVKSFNESEKLAENFLKKLEK